MPKQMIRYRIETDAPTTLRVPRYAALRLFACVAGAPHIWLEQNEPAESTRRRTYYIVQGDTTTPDGREWVASTISDGISLHLYLGENP